MLKKKRFYSLFIIVAVSFSLVACGRESVVPDDLEEENTNLIVVGFSQPGAESSWRVALTDSVKECFTEKRGYKLIYRDGQSKQDNQIRDIRTFIQQGVDYIVISPIVEDGWDTVLSEAKAADIPVIICDRNVVVENESLYTAFVGSDFKAEGESATNCLKQMLDENSVEDDGSVNIVHIQGTIGSSAQIGRTKALENAIIENPNWNIVYQNCGEFTKAKAREIMAEALEEVGAENIDIIYCENDEEAFGAMEAMNDSNVPYGSKGDIKIISFDATTRALKMCMYGNISVEVECNPRQGPYIYGLINRLQRGETVPKITYVHEDYFTADCLNIDFIDSRKY